MRKGAQEPKDLDVDRAAPPAVKRSSSDETVDPWARTSTANTMPLTASRDVVLGRGRRGAAASRARPARRA